MSDITISVTQPPSTTINVGVDETKLIQAGIGLPPHSATHISGGSDELFHNTFGGLQGGSANQYYHLSSGQYFNLTTGAVVRPSDTGQFYPTSNPSGFITGFNSGDYSQITFVTGISGDLQSQIYLLSSNTGSYYLNSNPSGYISTGDADLRFVNVTGEETIFGQKRFFDNIFFESGIDISGLINFNLNQQINPLEGQVSWHPDYGTIQIGMNGGDVINPVGFKNFYRVKASEEIRKGKVVMAVGAVGNSEFILAQEAHGIGSSGELIMGISSENISKNEFGDVVAFGAVRGINTSSYPLDSILYYDPLITGGLTAQIPEAPNAKVIVGFNASQANNGIVFVRVTAGSQLGNTDSNVKFTTLADKDVLFYDLNSGLWINRQINTGDISGINNYVLNSATGQFYPNSNPSGFITGVDLSSFATTSFVTGISGFLENQIIDLNNQTGNYYTIDNPSGYITGLDLSNYSTIGFTTGISGYLQNQIIDLNNATGDYYLASNPSGYITGVDLSSYVTGDVIRPSDTGIFYTNDNPSGFITGVDLSSYAEISFVTGISGDLNSSIQILESQTGDYYQNSNPSGFITGVDQVSFVTLMQTGIEETGINFPYTFAAIPRVLVDMQLVSDTGYLVGIKNVTATGYTAIFSDIIEETGLYLHTFATNQ
jgi:hypothetical protein